MFNKLCSENLNCFYNVQHGFYNLEGNLNDPLISGRLPQLFAQSINSFFLFAQSSPFCKTYIESNFTVWDTQFATNDSWIFCTGTSFDLSVLSVQFKKLTPRQFTYFIIVYYKCYQNKRIEINFSKIQRSKKSRCISFDTESIEKSLNL